MTTVPGAHQDSAATGGPGPSRPPARRWLIRLALAAAALLVLCIAGLVALIFATSAPQIPPKVFASPNEQVQALLASGRSGAAAQTDLAYESFDRPGTGDAPCESNGRWALDVNPEDVVGHPYARLPSARDWARAAAAMATATAICPAAVALTWYGHDPAHPASDTWTALVPAPVAAAIGGPALRRFALRHARQM